MPRILLSTAHLVPSILDSLDMAHQTPSIISDIPDLPSPFFLSQDRLDRLKDESVEAYHQRDIDASLASAKKGFVKRPDSKIRGDVNVIGEKLEEMVL